MNACEREQSVIELAWLKLHYAQAGSRFGVCSNDEALRTRQQALDLATNYNLAAVRAAVQQPTSRHGRRRPG